MEDSPKNQLLRAIPAVDEILSHARVAPWRAEHPHFPWTRLVRAILDDVRDGRVDAHIDPDRAAVTAWVVEEVSSRVGLLRRGGLRPVLNGTGVVLHTNLGRAPVGERAIAAATRALQGYVSLEIDLSSGERAKRGELLEQMFRLLTGAEAAMVVNNNAAAVYLVANSFSPPGRIIVSRGELVEIGGSFRLPEILRHAAAEVVEVGTTNRTYVADYEKAARPGDVLMKVHKSNYEIEGFAHEATIAELVDAGRRLDCRVVFDLGSGALFDFTAAGVGSEPVTSAVIEQGVDAVTMSGDKLLGGVQAGIVVGRRTFIDRLKQNPLRRVVRVDKVTVAALQETARSYLFACDPRAEVPVLAQITADPSALRARAERIAAAVARAASREVTVAADDAAAGGGSLASSAIGAAAVVVPCAGDRDAARLARALRLGEPPVFARVKGSDVRVNLSTIFEREDEELTRALIAALLPGGNRPAHNK